MSNNVLLDPIISNFNGSTTIFDLKASGVGVTPGVAQNLLVVLGGIVQSPNFAYSISNSSITFATPPTANEDCFMIMITSGEGGVTWSPLSLSGLQAWYHANSTNVTVSGNNVTSWTDLSGTGADLRVSGSPVYESTGFNGKPTVHVNKAGSYSVLWTDQGAISLGANCATFSVFFVGQYINTPADGRLVSFVGPASDDYDYLSGESAIPLMVEDTSIAVYTNGHYGAVITTSANTNYRIGTIIDETVANTYLNNTTTNTFPLQFRSVPTPSFGGNSGLITLSLGSQIYNSGNTAALTGYAVEMLVSEVVITNSVISSTDRTNLDNYFKTQWGL